MLCQLIEGSKEAACDHGDLDEFGNDGVAIAVYLPYYLSDHIIIVSEVRGSFVMRKKRYKYTNISSRKY